MTPIEKMHSNVTDLILIYKLRRIGKEIAIDLMQGGQGIIKFK